MTLFPYDYLEGLPAGLDASVETEAPVFNHEGNAYLMVGADARHEHVTTTQVSFTARASEGVLEMRSRLLSGVPLDGLVVQSLVVETDQPVEGINVTRRPQEPTAVTIETADGPKALLFGDDPVLMFDDTFNWAIDHVFVATALQVFKPKPQVEKKEVEWPPHLLAQLEATITPEKLREIEERSKPVFYMYRPADRKVKRIVYPR